MANYNTAVIDIGSNSVRLVIYRVERRSIWPVFNEKVLAGLGRDMWTTGLLHPDGKRESLVALRRFKAVLESYTLEHTHIVATAAIREASDGPAFAATIREQTGFEVRILTGAEEAYYSAQGVHCGHLDAKGVVGDLGGSSLELINLDGEETGKGVTLPLGPFALGAPRSIELEKTRATILAHIEPLRDRFSGGQFHAVGGAWRNLALIWMMKQNYPLHVIQQFELPAREAVSVCSLIAGQSLSSLEKMAGVPKRRLENISYAALVLQCLVETFGYDSLCFSAFGLREGLLFDALDGDLKHDDPLIAGCTALGKQLGINDDLGKALSQWARDYYDSADNALIERPDEKLIRAAAKLADIGARLHPDHRADLVCEQVLRAPIPGQTHEDRVFLASALYTRYSGDAFESQPVLIRRILGEEKHQLATQLGLLLRLGCDLSAKSAKLLSHATVRQNGLQLILSAPGWEDLLLGETTRRRARALAQNLKLTLQIIAA